MENTRLIKSVAIIGAGASGAITAAAFAAENHFDRIRVFERRASPGGTWIYDPNPSPALKVTPGALPTQIDPPLRIPAGSLPKTTAPSSQERFEKTPVYEDLTTNVPDIAMSFSDGPFAYGPFVPHYIPRQYIENYFSTHNLDNFLVLNTTVEDVSKLKDSKSDSSGEKWKITLRRYDAVREVDEWWEEVFDAVVIANGHYSVPFVPEVKGLSEYISLFPDRVKHSKFYRAPREYTGKKVLVIGNSASGHDISLSLVSSAAHPVYQSRRSVARWDGTSPPKGIDWKPIITEFLPNGRILFEDGTFLDDVDTVIYCTGYKPSYPFWNSKANDGVELWDYEEGRVKGNYLHTFLRDVPTVTLVGIPRVLTFRGFEYQAVAIARVFAGRSKKALWDDAGIGKEEMRDWEEERWKRVSREKKRFHDIEWETGDTIRWFEQLFEIAGLGTLAGEGRIPPVLGERVRWALEHIRKYPEPRKDRDNNDNDDNDGNTEHQGEQRTADEERRNGWVVVERDAGKGKKDLLSFI